MGIAILDVFKEMYIVEKEYLPLLDKYSFYLQLGHLLFLRFTLAAIRAIYSEPQEEQMNQACFCELALKSYGVVYPFLIGCHSAIRSGF